MALVVVGSVIMPQQLIEKIPGIEILGTAGFGTDTAQAAGDILPTTIGQSVCPPIAFSENETHYIINNAVFIFCYDKTGGTNDLILDLGGHVLVTATKWQLQVISTKSDITGTTVYEKVSDYEYEVTRTFTAPAYGATLKLIWNIQACDGCKLTVDFQNGNVIALSGVAFNWLNTLIGGTGVLSGDRVTYKYVDGSIGFDWSDVTVYDVTPTVDGVSSEVKVTVGAIPRNAHIIIDPVTVGTSTSTSLFYSYQRKMTYAASNYWLIATDGTDFNCYSSLDGASWNETATLVSGDSASSHIALWYDGASLCVGYATGTSNQPLQYRQYTPYDNGTIVAQTGWQNAVAAVSGKTYYSPFPCKDSNGKPVMAYNEYDSSSGELKPYVTRATQTDGTWTSSDFNTLLSSTSDINWRVGVLPLPDGDLIAIYARDGQTVKSKVYDGSWQGENATALAIEVGSDFSAVVTSDGTPHMVFLEDVDYDIQYTSWNGTAWATEEVVYAGTTAVMPPVLSRTVADGLYCFWLGDNTSNHVYYKGCSAGIWDALAEDWLTESSVVGNDRITAAYEQTTSDYLPLVWLTGSGSPYSLRFAALKRELEPWLTIGGTRYEDRSVLSITGVSAVSQPITLTNQAASKDAWLGSYNPTYNYGGSTYLRFNNTAATRPILEFNCSTWGIPSEADNVSAILSLWYYANRTGGGPGSRTYHFYQLSDSDQVDDWEEGTLDGSAPGAGVAGATWNRYKNIVDTDWPGGAGALGDCDTSINGTYTFGASPSFGEIQIDVTDIVVDAVANEGGYVRILAKDSAEGSGTNNSGFDVRSAEYTTEAQRPKLTLTYDYYVDTIADDKVVANVFKGYPTVESCDITIDTGVDNRTFNHCIDFTIQTYGSAITANTYPIRVVVDTAALVTGGFTSSNNTFAKRVEWARSDGSYPMKYWATELNDGAGVETVRGWNTTYPGTVYYITPSEALNADNVHSFTLFVDEDIASDSPNYGGADMAGTSGLFEDFDEPSADLTEFLADYDGDPNTYWVKDPVSATNYSVNVTDSILNVKGTSGSGVRGIATNFTLSDFRLLIGYQDTPGTNAYSGVFDVAGLHASNNLDGMLDFNNSASSIIWTWCDNASGDQATWDIDYFWLQNGNVDGPFIGEFVKYEDEYRWFMWRDDPSSLNLPDSSTYVLFEEIRREPVTDEAQKVLIGSYGTNDLSINWVLFVPELAEPPRVTFPDVLYETVGTIFCQDQFTGGVSGTENWYNELAFTMADKTTQIFWRIDEQAQLSKQPGESVRVEMKFTSPLTANTVFFCYFGFEDASGTPAYCSDADVYNTIAEDYRWQDMSSTADWSTDGGGSWALDNISMPVMDKGPVGNVGGAAGRCWARMPNTVKWDTNSYYNTYCIAQWEIGMVGWPAPYGPVYIAHSTSPEIEPDIGYTVYPFAQTSYPHLWPQKARVFGEGASKKMYITFVGADGFEIVYSDDPSDPDSWQVNPNGPFVTSSWLASEDATNFGSAFDCTTSDIVSVGGQFYIMIMGVYGALGHAAYATAVGNPEDWTMDNITYGAKLLDEAVWLEDDDLTYDAAEDKFYWSMVYDASVLRYFVFDNGTDGPFPGSYGDWGSAQSFTIEGPPIAGSYRSPRILVDDSGDFVLHFSNQPVPEGGDYDTRWQPNYIYAAKSTTTIAGTFSRLNVDSQYKQSTSTGVTRAYVTDSSADHGSITCDIILSSSGADQAGILFKYDDVGNNGYFYSVTWNSGAPQAKLQSMYSATLYAISGAANYDMPQFPTPWLYYGVTAQLRVDFYGEDIETYLSLWGNEWQLIHSVSNTLYMGAGHYGVATSGSAAWFNNFAFRDFVDQPAYISTAGESTMSITVSPDTLSGAWAYLQGAGGASSGLRMDTWYTTEALAGNPSSGTPLFMVTNDGTDTVDVSITSSDNWSGIGKTWTVSPTGTPGDASIGIWAGLDSDTGYGTLVKTDEPGNILIFALGAGQHDHFGLLIYTCTSNGGGVVMSGTVTLTAMVHT